MATNIEDAETDRLVREYARLTGTSYDGAIQLAVRTAMEREPRSDIASEAGDDFVAHVARIRERVAKIPLRLDRTPDEIMGYDENGLPT